MASDADIEKLVGRFASMRALAQQALRDHPNDARALFGAAMALRISADHEASLKALERLCALDPANTHFLYERGVGLEYLGRFEEAAASHAAALKAVPENYKARQALVQLRKQSAAQNDIAELERQFAPPEGDGWRTLHLGHALAKTYEDMGDAARSFAWLDKAKARRRQLNPYDAKREEALTAAAMQAAPQGQGCDSAEPIFVAGLPRSGTTLTDRILSSHPDVISAGEIGNFAQMLKLMSGSATPATLDGDVFARAGAVDMARLGRAYIDSTRPLTGTTARFIDKAPSNYYQARVLLAALPNARIVCMRRHPLDSVLSNFKQMFPFDDRYYDYAYGLESAAHKFIQFDKLARHWRETLPAERFMLLQYEDLVTDQEARTRALLAFCGLDWNDACLSFHENKAGVATPSARQVRSAMYATAVRRWERYGALLDPARAVLERAGIDCG